MVNVPAPLFPSPRARIPVESAISFAVLDAAPRGVTHEVVGVTHEVVGVTHEGVGVTHEGVGVIHESVGGRCALWEMTVDQAHPASRA